MTAENSRRFTGTFLLASAFNAHMKWKLSVGFLTLAAGLACGLARAQDPAAPPPPDASQSAYNSAPAPNAATVLSPVPLEWTPPALERLSAHAAVKENFTLDRNLLARRCRPGAGLRTGRSPGDSKARWRQRPSLALP